MDDPTHSFNYRFFSKEDIDTMFNAVLEKCSTLTSYDEIIKTINNVFYNRMLLMTEFEQETPDLYVYRVTRVYEGFDPTIKDCFSYPPNPNLGRANLKGVPVFYCSFNQATALREMKDLVSSKETLYISEWRIKFTKSVYAHAVLINSITENKEVLASVFIKKQLELTNQMMYKAPEVVTQGLKQFLLKIGDLFTLPSEEHYKITSAYAHNALYDIKNKGGVISMIMYPSVACGHNGINFAIHPDFVNSSLMQLNKVLKIEVTKVEEDGISISVSEKGFVNEEGGILWKKPTIRIKEIEYNNIQIWTHDNNTFKGEAALNMTINNSSILVGDYIKKEHSKVDLIDGLTHIPFTDDVFEFNSAERNHLLVMQCEHGIKVETNSKNKEGCNCISHIAVPVTWIDEYK